MKRTGLKVFAIMMALALRGAEPPKLVRQSGAESPAPALTVMGAFARQFDYFTVADQVLIPEGEFYWMIVLPSFQPEYAVLLKSRPRSSAPKDFQQYVEVVRAQKPIFGWEDKPDGSQVNRYDTKVPLAHMSKDLSPEDALLLGAANFAALRRARVDESFSGTDGVIYLFCFDRHSARTWSPISGDPAAMVEAWESLAEFVNAKTGAAEEAALKKFRGACAKISQ